jgi:hypothetical protein
VSPPAPASESASESASEPDAAPAPAAGESNVEAVNVDDLPVIWQRMLDLLAARGAWLYSALKTGRLASIDAEAVVLQFDRSNATFVKLLSGKKDLLRDIMTQAVGKPLGVRFEVAETGAATDNGDGSAAAAAAAVMPPPSATRVQSSPPPRGARPVQREIEPPPPAPAQSLMKITPEVIETLRNNEPLIKGLMDELGAQIVKIESPETVNT